VILQMLLGGGAVPPEEEKELMLSVARTLKDKGITNINGLNNFVNLLSSDNETLEFIQKAEFGITELKNIVEAQHPQGMNEKTLAGILLNNPNATEVEIALKANEISLPTAQSVAVRRFMQQGKEDKLLQQYDSLVKDFYMMQSQKYALSAQERARIFTQNMQAKSDAFERNYPVLATTTGIGKKLALAPLSIVMLIPKFAIMGAVGRLLPFGNMQSSNMLAKAFNSFIGVSTADMLLNKNNNEKSNVQELSLPETALSLVYGIGNIVNVIKNKKALVKSVNNVSAFVNLKLSEAALMSTEEIKAKLATAGIEINKDTDTTIANMKEYFDNLSPEEDKSTAKDLTLKDISKFESVKDKEEEKSVENEEDTDMQAVSGGEQETGKVIPFVSKCAKTAVEGMGVKYDENKTAGDYVLDVLKVAGIMTKGAVSIAQSFMGTVRANLGQDYEYAILTDTSKLDNDVIAYYENEKGQGHVEKVRNRAEIEAKEIEGYKFTGIVLADKKVIKETETMNEIYSTEAVKEILKVMDTSKLSKEMVVEIEETLGTVINGVTAPEEMNLTVSAVLAICENANEIAQLIGYKDIEEVKSGAIEDIISKYNEKVGQVLSIEDIDEQDMQATIKILSVTRDMLIMVKKDESMIEKLDNPKTTVEDIMSKLIISKAVNQNIVTELVKESVGRSDGDKDFVIDIEKLRNAITEKITVKNAEDKLKDLGALLVQGRGAGKKSMPIALMKISDIRAVVAAA